MATERPPHAKPVAYFLLLRPNRSLMVAMITGAAAYAAGAGADRALWMTLGGWLLAVGGFSLDFWADRDLDSTGPRAAQRHNPVVTGAVGLRESLAFSVTFIVLSGVVVWRTAPGALPAWVVILTVIAGLACHLFETPLARAFSLGLLQGLYALMGAAAGRLSVGLVLLAGMFFFAMFGGRGMIDIRDFPQDLVTRVQTLPKRYGLRRTALFTAACLLVAYGLSYAAYLTGEFSRIYLYLDLVFVGVGVVCALVFAIWPSPRLAYALTLVFMMGEGLIICLAMILGSTGV